MQILNEDDYALKGICTEAGKVGGIADRDIPDPVTCERNPDAACTLVL